ncbi:MAG TPA: hypothetical protein VEZ15_15815 [Acidimicrobiia bacterium]|jgi:hypothetical protein|nr:hypothetical protein [Acidimicrobiia bacterium]
MVTTKETATAANAAPMNGMGLFTWINHDIADRLLPSAAEG